MPKMCCIARRQTLTPATTNILWSRLPCRCSWHGCTTWANTMSFATFVQFARGCKNSHTVTNFSKARKRHLPVHVSRQQGEQQSFRPGMAFDKTRHPPTHICVQDIHFQDQVSDGPALPSANPPTTGGKSCLAHHWAEASCEGPPTPPH